jgi:hypothetical protein
VGICDDGARAFAGESIFNAPQEKLEQELGWSLDTADPARVPPPTPTEPAATAIAATAAAAAISGAATTVPAAVARGGGAVYREGYVDVAADGGAASAGSAATGWLAGWPWARSKSAAAGLGAGAVVVRWERRYAVLGVDALLLYGSERESLGGAAAPLITYVHPDLVCDVCMYVCMYLCTSVRYPCDPDA